MNSIGSKRPRPRSTPEFTVPWVIRAKCVVGREYITSECLKEEATDNIIDSQEIETLDEEVMEIYPNE